MVVKPFADSSIFLLIQVHLNGLKWFHIQHVVSIVKRGGSLSSKGGKRILLKCRLSLFSLLIIIHIVLEQERTRYEVTSTK